MAGVAYPLCVDRCSTRDQMQPNPPATLNLPPLYNPGPELEKSRQMQIQNEIQQEQLNQRRSSNSSQQVDLNRFNAIYQKGVSLLSIKKWEQAVAVFDKTIDMMPNHALSYACRGTAYHYLQKYDLAFADLDLAIALDPKTSLAYEYRGLTNGRLEKLEETCSDLKKACSLGLCENYEKVKGYCIEQGFK